MALLSKVTSLENGLSSNSVSPVAWSRAVRGRHGVVGWIKDQRLHVINREGAGVRVLRVSYW